MSMSSPPDSIRTIELHRGGMLILAGSDTEMQITLLDEAGEGGTVTLNLTAAEQVHNAILDRLLHIEARSRGRR